MALQNCFLPILVERQRDWLIAWIDRNQAKGQKATLFASSQFFGIGGIVLMVHVHPEIAVKGVSGIS